MSRVLDERALHAAAAAALSDGDLETKLADLDRRRPGAPVASVGVRPRRRPWTYRQIWELEALRAERSRRGA
jgi:hypothetical protein